MNLPAQRTDVWTPATDGDKLKALALLGALPARQALSPDVEDASFLIALDGVTKHGLEEAVKFILRGSLKHAFFPNPAELRQECDKAMEWPEREAERIRRREAIERDRELERQRAAAEQELLAASRARLEAEQELLQRVISRLVAPVDGVEQPFVQDLGVGKIHDFVSRFHINAVIPKDMSLSLGSFGISLAELAKGFAVFNF